MKHVKQIYDGLKHKNIIEFHPNFILFFLSREHIQNGRLWSNDGLALRNHRYFIIPFYVLHTWSKAGCCRKPQYLTGRPGLDLYDFIWS